MPPTLRTDGNLREQPTKSKKGEVRVDRSAGEAGVIYGISVIELGRIIDNRGFVIDATTLQMTIDAINKRPLGQKGRFTHPDMCHDGLGTEVARFTNARLSDDGRRVLADAHMLEIGRVSPNGNLTDWILDAAEKSPDMLEISIAPDSTFRLEAEKDEDGVEAKEKTLYRFDGLRGVDFVDKGAANRRGLFGDSDVTLSAQAASALDAVLADQPKLKAPGFGETQLLTMGLNVDLNTIKAVSGNLSEDRLSTVSNFVNSYLDRREIEHEDITPGLLRSVLQQLTEGSAKRLERLNKRRSEDDDGDSKQSTPKGQTMPPDTTTDPAGDTKTDPIDLAAERKKAAEAERKRIADITKLCNEYKDFNLGDLRDKLIEDPEITVDQAKVKILDRIKDKMDAGEGPIVGHVGPSGGERQLHDMQLALGYQLSVFDPRNDEDKAALATIRKEGLDRLSLSRMGYDFLELSGERRVNRLSKSEVFDKIMGLGEDRRIASLAGTAGYNTPSHFPILFESTVRRAIISRVAAVMLTWEKLSSVGNLEDFREAHRVMISGLGEMQEADDAEGPEQGTFATRNESIVLATFKKYFGFTRKMFVNDDTSSLVRIINQISTIHLRTIENQFWRLLLSNAGVGPTLNDNVALFHTDHKNIATSGDVGAPDQAKIEAMLVNMFKQTDFGEDGEDNPLGIMPRFIVAGMARAKAIRKIINALYLDHNQGSPQDDQVKNLEVIDVPYLTVKGENDYYTVADPSTWPGMEVAFLNGNRNPTVMSETGLDFDGQRFLVRHDWGIGYTGYHEAWYRNPG